MFDRINKGFKDQFKIRRYCEQMNFAVVETLYSVEYYIL